MRRRLDVPRRLCRRLFDAGGLGYARFTKRRHVGGPRRNNSVPRHRRSVAQSEILISTPSTRRRSRRYHGEFRDGKPNGYGEMRYASGASHRGLWERGERNGSGVFVDVDGSVIETLWKGDLPETAE